MRTAKILFPAQFKETLLGDVLGIRDILEKAKAGPVYHRRMARDEFGECLRVSPVAPSAVKDAIRFGHCVLPGFVCCNEFYYYNVAVDRLVHKQEI
jgi:hypothetical protein